MSLNTRKACRSGHRCEPQGKEHFHCAIGHSEAGFDGVAEELQVSPSTLRDACNTNEPDWLSARHLEKVLVLTADHPVLANWFARLQGGLFIAPRVPATPDEAAIYGATSHLMTQLAEAVRTVERKFRDGRITFAEIPECDRELNDVVEAALSFQIVIRQVAQAQRRAREGRP